MTSNYYMEVTIIQLKTSSKKTAYDKRIPTDTLFNSIIKKNL